MQIDHDDSRWCAPKITDLALIKFAEILASRLSFIQPDRDDSQSDSVGPRSG